MRCIHPPCRGVAGRLTGGTPARLVLDPPVRFRGAAGYETGGVDKHHLLLRLPDGELHSSAISHPDGAGAGGETDTVVLESPLPAAPDANGSSPADTLWRLYSPDGPVARARIVSVEPLDERRIRFTAIDEVDEYHQAAVSDLSVTLPALTSREVRVVAIAISEQLIRAGPGYAVELTATVTVAGPYQPQPPGAGAKGHCPRLSRVAPGAPTRRARPQHRDENVRLARPIRSGLYSSSPARTVLAQPLVRRPRRARNGPSHACC